MKQMCPSSINTHTTVSVADDIDIIDTLAHMDRQEQLLYNPTQHFDNVLVLIIVLPISTRGVGQIKNFPLLSGHFLLESSGFPQLPSILCSMSPLFLDSLHHSQYRPNIYLYLHVDIPVLILTGYVHTFAFSSNRHFVIRFHVLFL